MYELLYNAAMQMPLDCVCMLLKVVVLSIQCGQALYMY